MEHLLKIAKGFEPSTRDTVNTASMRFFKRRKQRGRVRNDWDNYYLVTGFIIPQLESQNERK